jgi:SAM-dependent methyltransferase
MVTASTDADFLGKNNELYDVDVAYSERVHGEESQRRNLDNATWITQRIGRSRSPGRKRFLDVGCSGGGMMMAFASLGYEAYGIEPSAAVRHAPPDLAPRIQNCFFGDETFQTTFDLISAFHVLEHVPSPAAFVDHCMESLAPGGDLVIEVPNFDFALRRLHDDFREAFSQISPHYHLNHFTMDGLDRLLRRRGFTVLRRDRVAPYRRATPPTTDHDPVPTNAGPGAIASPQSSVPLRSRMKQVVWKSRVMRNRIRHTLANTLGFGRYIRIYARADRPGG